MEERTWHQLDAGAVCRLLATDRSRGLSGDEASRRLAEAGPNELAEADKASPVALFVGQFKDFMVLVLVAAALVSGLLGEFLDAITILAIIVMNGILGFAQEYRAEKSLRALRQLASPMARAVRDGRTLALPARELVPGDVVLLESGDRVPADVRILEAESLHIEESALTGESVPVEKHAGVVADAEAPLGDRRNMGFMGTMVTRGTGRGVVVRTGMATEMGRIAHLIQATDAGATPLQRRLEQLGKILIAIAVMLTAAVAVAGILHGQPAYDMFLAGVSLAVAAIPEELPAILTVTMAVGVQRMAARNAIIRRLPAVETLGSVSVICADKTGTLTRNEMTVQAIVAADGTIQITGTGYAPVGGFYRDGAPVQPGAEPSIVTLARAGLLCNEASLREQDGEWVVDGDPVDGALLALAYKAGLDPATELAALPRADLIPFDSQYRYMASLHHDREGSGYVFVKGAPERLLEMSEREWSAAGERPLDRAAWEARATAIAAQGLRVLALAYKRTVAEHRLLTPADVERGLVLLGLVGLIDPPREEAIRAIAECKAAGITVKMITGDHPETARAIARQLKMENADEVLTGADVEQMSDEALRAAAPRVNVFARAAPVHKLRLVEALQA